VGGRLVDSRRRCRGSILKRTDRRKPTLSAWAEGRASGRKNLIGRPPGPLGNDKRIVSSTVARECQ